MGTNELTNLKAAKFETSFSPCRFKIWVTELKGWVTEPGAFKCYGSTGFITCTAPTSELHGGARACLLRAEDAVGHSRHVMPRVGLPRQ
jgi:hypothetical protein